MSLLSSTPLELEPSSAPSTVASLLVLWKTSLFERSWKSAFRRSVYSSKAAKCALTNEMTVEPTVIRTAVAPLFP